MFTSASQRFLTERKLRRPGAKLLRFGNAFLDDALLCIKPEDLILVGAPSGVGKTQFCVNLALTNIEDGRRVHFFALEAAECEIEMRLKYRVLMEQFYADPNRPRGKTFLFDEWETGAYEEILAPYEEWAEKYCVEAYKNLHTFYKLDQFDVSKLIELVTLAADETDLIIVDHVHFFDWDDQNDNRAIKEIAKATRDLCRNFRIPIVLVAHLRKKDKANAELVAGLDEFHGSSDLPKIATKVITIASGGPSSVKEGCYTTYIRTPKNRHLSSSTAYLAQILFNEQKGSYEKEYKLGWANAQKFGEIEAHKHPKWFNRSRRPQWSGTSDSPPTRTPRGHEINSWDENSNEGAHED